MKGCSEADRILLVEGESDLHVVLHLWRRIEEKEPFFCISDKRGKDPLLESIPNEVRASNRKAVGIILDADDCPRCRWASVSEKLRQVGITAPESPIPGGTFIPESKRFPRIGIWLMPDNKSPGELEDFFRTMLPENEPVWPLSKAYIDEIPKRHRRFKRRKALRAKIHAWLATRKRPGRMGVAIAEKDVGVNGRLATSFHGWLRRVFGDSDADADGRDVAR